MTAPLARLRAQLGHVLHLNESPHRTALAFALGLFIAFSPTYGFHTLSAIFLIWAFRLNAVALMAGAFVNNPWTVVPIIAATFWTGFQLMGRPEGNGTFQWDHLTLEQLYAQIQQYGVPFFVGGLILSLAAALIAYPVAYWIISRARARRRTSPDDPVSVAGRNRPEL